MGIVFGRALLPPPDPPREGYASAAQPGVGDPAQPPALGATGEAVSEPTTPPLPPGFSPPSTGTVVVVLLRSGKTMRGTLRALREDSLVLESGKATIALSRHQLDRRSRVGLFAADFVKHKAAVGTAPAPAPKSPAESPKRDNNYVDVFFKPFDGEQSGTATR